MFEEIPELKAKSGKFRIMGIDKFEKPGEGHFYFGDYDTLDEALKIAIKEGKEASKDATDPSIATVFYVYDDKGDYKGGDIYKEYFELLKNAETFAKKQHKGQFRKDGTTEYFEHLKDVVWNLKCMEITDVNILCAGWLHDTIEDTPTDYDKLKEKFNKKIADYVASVTKETRLEEKLREKLYISQLKKSSWQAKVVKLGDILANLQDLPNANFDSIKEKKQAKKKIPYLLAIKSGLSENKKKIPDFKNAQLKLTPLLKKYGLKPISF